MGHSAVGFMYCISSGGLVVSFASSKSWLSPSIIVQLNQLADDGSVDVSDVSVPHISLPAHVDSHRLLLVPGVNVPVNGEEIWRRRGELLPGIDFLPRVEAQIALYAKGMPETFQIIARLMEMQASISIWNSAVDPQPNWATKITGESESRREKCYFNAPSGESILYEMHARFTPGAGRIHFRIFRERSRIEIAHIGAKLT